MGKTLIIAEKPSVARDIAAFLTKEHGYKVSRDGNTFDVGPFYVTNLRGHILENADPAAYNPKFGEGGWATSAHLLPCLPNPWRLIPKEKTLLSNVKNLLAKSDRVIHAGDPDEEGQLLVDEVLLYLGNKHPVDRLWLNAVDDASIRDAFKKIRPNSDFHGWFLYSLSRSHGDWVFGINVTRAFTVAAQNRLVRDDGSRGPIHIGRVKTPVCALVVNRELEIRHFKPKDYFVPWIDCASNPAFRAKWRMKPNDDRVDDENRLLNPIDIQNIVKAIKANPVATITDYKDEIVKEQPPLPFALSSMQELASSKFGLGGKATLEVMQKLYEAKLTSYPRTDCDFLPESQHAEAPTILASLSGIPEVSAAIKLANTALKSNAWNDKKTTAHHGIVPRPTTAGAIAALDPMARKLYLEVVKRYILQFYPPAQARKITIELDCGNEKFQVTGKAYVDRGWRDAFKGEVEEDEKTPALPIGLKKGDQFKVSDCGFDKKTTTAPKRFTEGSLIMAMVNIHQYVKDPAIKKILRENIGIGTEATRANLIADLISDGYFKVEKKYLVPTEFAISVISVLPVEITIPDLTAGWQEKMIQIKEGKFTYEQFMANQVQWVRNLVQKAPEIFANLKVKLLEVAGKKEGDECPECKQGLLQARTVVKDGPNKGVRFLICSEARQDDDSCKFMVFPPRPGGTSGKPGGKPNTAGGKAGPKLKIGDAIEGGACPKCKSEIVTRTVTKDGPNKGIRFLVCSAGKDKCDFIKFPKK